MRLERRAAYLGLARPILFGHRGLGTVAAENTLEAIAAAADQGADGVEIDVRPCRSGELLVTHDRTLARLTGGADHRLVAEVDFAELERIELVGGARLTTLPRVLALCHARGLALNVEIKRDVPDRRALTRAVADLLGATDPFLPLVVSSFDPFIVMGMALLCPDVPRAILLHRGGRLPLGRLTGLLGVSAVHVERTRVTAEMVARWHRRGLAVMVWTVNHEAEARDLLAIGVDGLITDDPARLLPITLGSRRGSSSSRAAPAA